jgi:hypothetical protein
MQYCGAPGCLGHEDQMSCDEQEAFNRECARAQQDKDEYVAMKAAPLSSEEIQDIAFYLNQKLKAHEHEQPEHKLIEMLTNYFNTLDS